MKNKQFFIGVDVSKKTLDVYCSELNEHIQIVNGTEGFKVFLGWCKMLQIDLLNAAIIMEYTGGYEYKLIQFCESKNIEYARIPGLAIKRSLGITRGKNDLVDAMRIAQYGEEKRKTIKPSKPLDPTILALKELLSFRKRLVRENAGYKATLKERKHIHEGKKEDFIIKTLQVKIKENLRHIEITKTQILELVKKDEEIKINYELLTSIKGIGMVNALMTIAYTENFTSFNNARSYAVYVGVIPFDHSSGTSIRGKKRVSHLANKELKQELTQAAKSAIQHDQELKEYATRKFESKAYGIVLNNVKFKLILRMFAVVKRQAKYVDNYQIAA